MRAHDEKLGIRQVIQFQFLSQHSFITGLVAELAVVVLLRRTKEAIREDRALCSLAVRRNAVRHQRGSQQICAGVQNGRASMMLTSAIDAITQEVRNLACSSN
jgi:hypothetical protein